MSVRLQATQACLHLYCVCPAVLTLCMNSFFLPTFRPPSTTQQPAGSAAVCRYRRWSELRRRHMSVMGAFKPCRTTQQDDMWQKRKIVHFAFVEGCAVG